MPRDFALSHAARKIREADTEARRIVSVNKGKVMHKPLFIHNKGVGDKSVNPQRDVGDRDFIIDHAVGFTGARGPARGWYRIEAAPACRRMKNRVVQSGAPSKVNQPLNTCRIPGENVLQADLQPRADYRPHRDTFSEPYYPGKLLCAIVLLKGDPYEKNIGSDHDTGGGRCRPVGE